MEKTNEKTLDQLLAYCWSADFSYGYFLHWVGKLNIQETVSEHEYRVYCRQKDNEMEKFFEVDE